MVFLEGKITTSTHTFQKNHLRRLHESAPQARNFCVLEITMSWFLRQFCTKLPKMLPTQNPRTPHVNGRSGERGGVFGSRHRWWVCCKYAKKGNTIQNWGRSAQIVPKTSEMDSWGIFAGELYFDFFLNFFFHRKKNNFEINKNRQTYFFHWKKFKLSYELCLNFPKIFIFFLVFQKYFFRWKKKVGFFFWV